VAKARNPSDVMLDVNRELTPRLTPLKSPRDSSLASVQKCNRKGSSLPSVLGLVPVSSIKARKTDIGVTSEQNSKTEKHVFNPSPIMLDETDVMTKPDLGKVNENATSGRDECSIKSHSVVTAEKEKPNKHPTPLLFSFAKAAMKDQTKKEERSEGAELQEHATSVQNSKQEKSVVNPSPNKTNGRTNPDLGKVNKNATQGGDELPVQSHSVAEAEKEAPNKHQTPHLFSFAKAALKDQATGAEVKEKNKRPEEQTPPVNHEVKRKKKRKQSRLSISGPTLVFFDQSPGLDARAESQDQGDPTKDRDVVERAYRLMDFDKPKTPPAVFQVKL